MSVGSCDMDEDAKQVTKDLYIERCSESNSTAGTNWGPGGSLYRLKKATYMHCHVAGLWNAMGPDVRMAG
jgi:hypothetical protein